MPSSSTTEKRSSAERARGRSVVELAAVATLACFATLVGEGCGKREAAPTAKREEPSEAPVQASSTTPVASEPSAAAEAANGPPAPDSAKGPPAPEGAALASFESVSAERLLGEVRRLGGKGTLVNAWASWCGPCKHELPMLEKLATKYAAAGIHVVLVSLDEPADREKAATFLAERKLALTSYLAERPLGPFKQGMNPRWPGMLPASFLYDSTGALRYFWGGEAFEEEVAPVLEAFAAGKRIQGEAAPAIGVEGETH